MHSGFRIWHIVLFSHLAQIGWKCEFREDQPMFVEVWTFVVCRAVSTLNHHVLQYASCSMTSPSNHEVLSGLIEHASVKGGRMNSPAEDCLGMQAGMKGENHK